MKYFTFCFRLFVSFILFLCLSAGEVSAQAFITTWIATGGSIDILTNGGGYNYNVTWTNLSNTGVGNGSATGVTGPCNITGLADGDTYRVAITGSFPRIFFQGNFTGLKIRTIEQWGNIAWTSMAGAFSGCSNLTYNATDAPNLTGVTDMSSMFANCTAFDGNATMSTWNTSNVMYMSGMFGGCYNFNGDISGWNTSNVTFMTGMFYNALVFNQNIGGWNTSNVIFMNGMFAGAAAFNQNIGGWNVSSVKYMDQMFSGATAFNQNLSAWNVSNVESMLQMFWVATAFNQSLGSWQLKPGHGTVVMQDMLGNCGMSRANYDATLIGWASNPNTPISIFLGALGRQYCTGAAARNTLITTKNWHITSDVNQCPGFVTTWVTTTNTITIPTVGSGYNYNISWTNLTNPGVGNGSATGVTGNYTITGLQNGSTYRVEITGTFPRFYMNGDAVEAPKLRTIAQWGNIAWTSMGNAFMGCANLTYTATDVPNLSGVANMSQMFRGCTNFNGNIGSWNTATVTNMSYMFALASNFNQPIGAWNTSNVGNMSGMFWRASAFNQPIGSWNTSKVADMSVMFQNANAFNQNISGWDVSNVTQMQGMFIVANAFNQPIGGWNTAKVTNMSGMFEQATAFNQPIGSWNTGNVTNMSSMFRSASAFNQPIGSWNTSKVTNMNRMFGNATAFNQSLNSWNTIAVNDMTNMFLNAASFNQFLASWNMGSVITAVNMLNNSGMSTANYDATLIGWAGQTLQTGVALGAVGRTYCTAVAARATLTSAPKNWTITGDALCPPARIEEEDIDYNNDFKIYPNPFETIFNIVLDVEKATYIKVYNALGKLINEKNLFIGDNKLQIDLANEANGIYFVEITNDKHMITRKVIKQSW